MPMSAAVVGHRLGVPFPIRITRLPGTEPFADRNGIFGIQVHHALVFKVAAGDTIIRGRNEKGIVKTNFPRPGLHLPIPVNLLPRVPQTKMPFPNDSSCVPCILKEFGQGVVVCRNGHAPGRRNDSYILAYRQTPREHGVTGGGAGCSRTVAVNKVESSRSQLIDIRRWDLCGTIDPHVAKTDIIAIEDHDIRSVSGKHRQSA